MDQFIGNGLLQRHFGRFTGGGLFPLLRTIGDDRVGRLEQMGLTAAIFTNHHV